MVEKPAPGMASGYRSVIAYPLLFSNGLARSFAR